jgi:hypothetical protein
VDAARRDTLRRSAQYFFGLRLVEMAMLSHDARAHTLAWKRIGHEHGLALHVRHAATIMAEVGDFGFESGLRHRQKNKARIRRPGFVIIQGEVPGLVLYGMSSS